MIMKKSLLIVLLFLLIQNKLYSQSVENEQHEKEKSVSVGRRLGAIGLCGVFIPGTYGWGSFYAENYIGFSILNGGGSTFTILAWYYYLNSKFNTTLSFEEGLEYTILYIICWEGTVIFAIASIIGGGRSVKRYNEKIKKKNDFLQENKRFNYRILPLEKGISINFTYEF